MLFTKRKYKRLQTLALAQNTLLITLIDHMHKNGLIDGDKMMDDYEKNLKDIMDDLLD